MRVLILGGRAPVALDHARRFSAAGWDVSIADCGPCRISSWSRSVLKTMRLPPPRADLPAFARALVDLVEEERIDLVLPTCEEAFYVSAIRDRLAATCSVFVAPFDAMRALHSKFQFLVLARSCGVEVPESALVTNLSDARDWANGRPVVLKPEYSRFGVFVRLYPQGIPAMGRPLPVAGPWVVQSFQRGRELCSYSTAVAGRVTAHVTYEPTYRLQGSSSYYFEPRAVPAVEAAVGRIVERLGYTGQISFDWVERMGGGVVPLECNPRAISGVHLFDRTDPLPEAMLGRVADTLRPRLSTPAMLAPVMLAAGLPRAIHRGDLHRWRLDWGRARDVLAVPGDIAPAIGAAADIAAFMALALRHRCSLRTASTRDLEWDGEALVP